MVPAQVVCETKRMEDTQEAVVWEGKLIGDIWEQEAAWAL